MVLIKLTAGIFFWQHNVIRAGDPAFEVDEATAKRLVEEKGVAEYAAPFVVEQTAPVAEVEPEQAEPELNDEEQAEPEKPLEDMTAKELREICAEYGLTLKGNASKAEMVKAIKAAWPVPADEDAPTFDAAEAVQ